MKQDIKRDIQDGHCKGWSDDEDEVVKLAYCSRGWHSAECFLDAEYSYSVQCTIHCITILVYIRVYFVATSPLWGNHPRLHRSHLGQTSCIFSLTNFTYFTNVFLKFYKYLSEILQISFRNFTNIFLKFYKYFSEILQISFWNFTNIFLKCFTNHAVSVPVKIKDA